MLILGGSGRMPKIDKERIKHLVKEFLKAIGENPDREGLKETPQRVADMCEEIFSGIGRSPVEAFKVFEQKGYDEMIIVKDIPFYSICEHHLLPFFGKAHIAYIPSENKITGFSELVKVLQILSKRPQLQERLTSELADFLYKALKPKGILVVIEAEHLCMTMRGVKKPGTKTITSAMRGIMRRPETRAEALTLIKVEGLK